MSSQDKRVSARTGSLLGNIQALRAVAALLVVLIHASLQTVGVESVLAAGEAPWLGTFQYIGLFGVDLFFVISGFIMLVTSWNNFGRRAAGVRFFVRRAIRIYPPYWLALLPALLVLVIAKDRFMVSHVGVTTGIFQSILLLPNPNKFVLTVAWTLVWEMIFYVVFSFLMRLDRKHIISALAAWFAIQVIFYLVFTDSTNFYLNFIATPLPMEFIFGAVVGLLYMENVFPAPRLSSTLCILSVLGMCITVTLGRIELTNVNDINRVLIFGISAMLLVYAAVALEKSRIFIAPRFLQRLGDGSYAIYLWHISILVIVRQIIERVSPAGAFAHAAVIVITLAIIIAFGLAVFHWFERPVTNHLNGRLLSSFPRKPAGSVVARVMTPSVSE